MRFVKYITIAAIVLLPGSLFARTAAGPARAQRERPSGPQWLAPNPDAEKALREGLAEANRTHKRLGVMYTGAWCELCDSVESTVGGDADLLRLEDAYVGVKVEVDRAALESFAHRIGAELPKQNALLITLLDSEGRVLARINTSSILEKGQVSAAKLKYALNEFVEGAPAAEVLAGSLPTLAASGKLGWVEFRADWCGWCHKMEKLFQESAAAPILAKYYSVVTVDTEKNDGSEALARRLGSVDGIDGIPWFAVVDAKGAVLATSEGPKGNIGFPDTDVEVAHFFSVLHKTAKGITDAEIATINQALKAK